MIDWLPEYFTPEKIKAVNDSFDFEVAASIKDRPTMQENLLDLSKQLDEWGVRHYLLFGTLLGAIREGDIIEGDHDVDLGIHPDDRWKLAARLGQDFAGLESRGWKMIRLWNELVSLCRHGEYVDLYFWGTREFSDRLWCLDYTLNENEFRDPALVTLVGKVFLTVNNPEQYLTEKYGPDWRTPQEKVATT